MSPAAELRLGGIRTQGDYGCPAAVTRACDFRPKLQFHSREQNDDLESSF